MFEDKDNPEASIVLHFPLVNVSFKQYKALGKHYIALYIPSAVLLRGITVLLRQDYDILTMLKEYRCYMMYCVFYIDQYCYYKYTFIHKNGPYTLKRQGCHF